MRKDFANASSVILSFDASSIEAGLGGVAQKRALAGSTVNLIVNFPKKKFKPDDKNPHFHKPTKIPLGIPKKPQKWESDAA